MNLLITSQDGFPSLFKLKKGITTFGDSKENSHSLKSLKDSSFSVENQRDHLVFRSNTKEAKLSGKWNRKVSSWESLQTNSLSLTVVPENFQLPRSTEDQNPLTYWSYENFPKNIHEKCFPKKLLKFILEGFGIDKGILFHKKEDFLTELASLNLKVKDQAELILKQFINDEEKSFAYIDFTLHSILFKADFEPINFYLFKQKLEGEEEAILYFPIPNNKNISPDLIQTILHLCAHSLSLHILELKNKNLHKQGPDWKWGEFYWGSSPEMNRIKKLLEKLAPSDLSILLQGETGTGKEALCEEITKKSPFDHLVSVNCASIPKELAESYLFGHVKGSFTGAHQNQMGVIEKSNGGTLFLDEIAELPLELQAKLLRVLQDKIVTPIGGKPKKVKFRLIAATHQNLNQMVQEGSFREDLFFRLNEATLRIPPLRDRQEDLVSLTLSLYKDFCHKNNLPILPFSNDAISWLTLHNWPGNFRELISKIRKAAILGEGPTISIADLQGGVLNENIRKNTFSWNLKEAKEQFIKNQIQLALKETKGNKSEAAQLLGISERSLYRAMSDRDDKDSATIDRDTYATH